MRLPVHPGRISLILIVVLLTGVGASGADDPDRVTVYAGATQYANPVYDSVALVEFPFSLKRHEFEFCRVDSIGEYVEARALAQVTIWDASGAPVDSALTVFSLRAADAAEAARTGLRVFNKLTLLLKPGMYSARVTVIDAVSRRRGDYFIDYLQVVPPRAGVMAVTEAQMAHGIRYVGDQSDGVQTRLVRNGYEVIPSPKSFFGTDDSLACIYAEIYNLAAPDDGADSFQVLVEILNADSSLHHPAGRRSALKPGTSAVIAESFDIDSWLPGLYHVRLTVTDGIRTTQSITPFRIISPQAVIAAYTESSAFDPYDTLSLEMKLRLVTYELTPVEKTTLDMLDDQGKETFLTQYWKERDERPSTAINETRLEMIRRLEYALYHYSSNAELTNGWLMDRGRILMTRGSYDRRDYQELPLKELEQAFEIWHYWREPAGTYYIFQDIFGDNEHRLVHSNDPAEIRSTYWQNLVDYGVIDLIQ